jgi:hypothetical protein
MHHRPIPPFQILETIGSSVATIYLCKTSQQQANFCKIYPVSEGVINTVHVTLTLRETQKPVLVMELDNHNCRRLYKCL